MNDDPRHLDDEALRDDLAAYALGALVGAEAIALEVHLEECSSCRERLRWLTPAVDVLGAAVPQESPPERLREILMATVRAEAASAGVAAAAPAPEPEPERAPSRSAPWWRSLSGLIARPAVGLATVVLLLAGIGVGYALRGSDVQATGSIYTDASGIGPAADEVSATLERHGDSATLHMQKMPALDPGEVYEVWLQRGGVMEPKSVFVLRRDGSAEAAVPGPLDGGEAVYVTAEPSGGTQQPSLPALLEADL